MFSRFVLSQVKNNSYFIFGLVIGFWIALVAVPFDEDAQPCVVSSTAAFNDDFEPHREEKPLGSGGASNGRSIQRPRYYSTELGMRGSLLAGVISSEAELTSRVTALNHTVSKLQPHLRFFITASSLKTAPGLANVVGFTDTREMLKPFHALKYLADNYLEEYDFFFLVSDTSFVNAHRLTELVSQLSVSQDVYMGTVADGDSHYCTLEGGILLSNSVLKAVHSELDWCVRNSYSPHHHENIGRCVLHAAHLSCSSYMQGENYISVKMQIDKETGNPTLTTGLADSVTAYPITEQLKFYQVHAYVSRILLERGHSEVNHLRSYVWRNSRRHPPQYRNATWPGGLRHDPGLSPLPPDTRWDHTRWTTFNATHAFMPNDHTSAAPIVGAYRKALDLVLDNVRAWAANRWSGEGELMSDIELVEGAWRWEPVTALHYRLLVRHVTTQSVHLVEVSRPLGAARLVSVPYVTESARVTLVLPVTAGGSAIADTSAFLRRYTAVCLAGAGGGGGGDTALIVVLVHGVSDESLEPIREAVVELQNKYRNAHIDILDATLDTTNSAAAAPRDEAEVATLAARSAFTAAGARAPRDALLLLAQAHMELGEEFLNRVRMNTIAGAQWYLPVPFARYSQYTHKRFREPDGSRPQLNTGRFNTHHTHALALYSRDYDAALLSFPGSVDELRKASVAEIMIRGSSLHVIWAPEPGVVMAPRGAPCGLKSTASPNTADPLVQTCLKAERDKGFVHLDLGAKHMLAKLLLELQADVSM